MKNISLHPTYGVLLIILLISCSTSKTYTPTQTSTTPRTGFLENEQINVVFFDSRKDKAQSEEIQQSIVDHLQKTYPSAVVQQLNNSDYFSSPSSNDITLKINIAGYNAGFGIETTSGVGSINGQPFVFNGVSDGKWNGLTGIGIMLYDYRDEQKKFTTKISDVVTRPNTGGFATARKALQESYQNVMENLSSFIDQNLME